MYHQWLYIVVIPDLIRNPVFPLWIPVGVYPVLDTGREWQFQGHCKAVTETLHQREGIENDSGLLLQGLWGCLWRKRAAVRHEDNSWAMPKAPQNLPKRDQGSNGKEFLVQGMNVNEASSHTDQGRSAGKGGHRGRWGTMVESLIEMDGHILSSERSRTCFGPYLWFS